MSIHTLRPRTLAATLAWLALSTHPAHATDVDTANDRLERGFSYFMGLGRQDVRYQETGSLLPFKSRAHSYSPLLITGGLYEVNTNLLFSLDSQNTFYPGRTHETWTATANTFNGTSLSDRLLQTNGFSLNQTYTQLLGHYRLQDQWFGLGGLAMRTQSFKRYSFEQGPDRAVGTPASATVEESTSELLLNLGWGLESERVRGSPHHYGLRVTAGLPVWRRVTNTNVPQAVFTGTRGLDLAAEGRYSWAVRPHVHLGLWGQWLHARRSRQDFGPTSELPASRLDSLSYGVELLWKL